MASTYQKFNQFVEDLAKGVHIFGTHTYKVMLSNTSPVATNAIKSAITEISAGNGYTAGGTATTITGLTQSSGILKPIASNVVFTASGGAIATFQYAVLYNDTQTSPVKPLVAWWDAGAAISLASGEVSTITFDATNGLFQLS